VETCTYYFLVSSSVTAQFSGAEVARTRTASALIHTTYFIPERPGQGGTCGIPPRLPHLVPPRSHFPLLLRRAYSVLITVGQFVICRGTGRLLDGWRSPIDSTQATITNKPTRRDHRIITLHIVLFVESTDGVRTRWVNMPLPNQ
jgi:hypothetical protein